MVHQGPGSDAALLCGALELLERLDFAGFDIAAAHMAMVIDAIKDRGRKDSRDDGLGIWEERFQERGAVKRQADHRPGAT